MKDPHAMGWFHEAVSDDKGLVDMALISIGIIVVTLLGTVVFLCTMSAISYSNCTVISDVGQGVRAAIPCVYDPGPLGLSVAAILGAFGSPIAALAAYMAATRRSRPVDVVPPVVSTKPKGK